MYMHVCVGVLYCRLNCSDEWCWNRSWLYLKIGQRLRILQLCVFTDSLDLHNNYTRTHTWTYAHTRQLKYEKLYAARICTHTHTHNHSCTHSCTCTHVHTHTCVFTCVCVYVLYVLPKDSLNPAHLPYSLHPTAYTLAP